MYKASRRREYFFAKVEGAVDKGEEGAVGKGEEEGIVDKGEEVAVVEGEKWLLVSDNTASLYTVANRLLRWRRGLTLRQ